MKIEERIVCRSCKGTGLYVGLAERNGSAVVCATCKGTGGEMFRLEYEPFKERIKRKDVDHVVQVNPGIVIGVGKNKEYDVHRDFGGISYNDWERGNPFPIKSEMRSFVCPAWWYQAADYNKKPNWKECGLGAFSNCEHFPDKQKCWERFDAEQKLK